MLPSCRVKVRAPYGAEVRFRSGSTAARLLLALAAAVSLFWVSRSLCQQKGLSASAWRLGSHTFAHEYLPTMHSSARKPAVADLSTERVFPGADESDSGSFFSSVLQDKLRVPGENAKVDRSIQILNFGAVHTPRPRSLFQPPMALSEEANFLAVASFQELFASIFGVNRADEAKLENHPEEAKNPFSEALRQTDEKSATVSARSTRTEQDKSTGNMQGTVAATGAPPESGFFFLGDWDGSGLLTLVRASRLNETTFAFPDARRTFSLFVNPSAVEEQRSLAIEDITGDGNVDLLVTSHANLLGGVFMGDGKGNFALLDTFVSGYEPVVATAGSFEGASREILATNVRTGIVSVFRAADRYRLFGEFKLGFVPDYVGHLVQQTQGADYFMAAQAGSPSQTFQLRDDILMERSDENLPPEPGLITSQPFSGIGMPLGILQVYQAGAYASVVLSNGSGDRFNVANLKVSAKFFLVIGDLDKNGTADVAAAFLK